MFSKHLGQNREEEKRKNDTQLYPNYTDKANNCGYGANNNTTTMK